MAELPSFMHDIGAKIRALPQNTMPAKLDGSATTPFGYSNGSNIMKGQKFSGQKSLPAKAGVTKVPSAGKSSKQVSKPSRKGK